uniref:Coenzyme Q5, methyltransferase n=1 Tax=Sinocyclocheilus anshuiensis TaxID=1608454 RepID=A0A671PQR8_9TELE
MAASIRTLVLRVLSDFTRNIHHVSRCQSNIDSTEDRSTHFGFQTVPEEEKAGKVYKVFESVAKKYDVMNDAMSLGIHRLWKDTLLHIMNPQPGLRLLDTAGGTGDISFRFLEYTRSMYDRQQWMRAKSHQAPSWQDIADRYASDEAGPPQSHAVVCDINKDMLKVGKQRAEKAGITTGLSWVVVRYIYTIAFGIRNVTHIEQALQEALRVLKAGGRFMCLEFSKVTNPLLARSLNQYWVGICVKNNFEIVRKLHQTMCLPQETFKEMIEDAGFFCVQYFNLTGGIVAIHSGFKL